MSHEMNIEPINDDLPDAQLFKVDIVPFEYTEIIHYIQKGEFPKEYTTKQKNRLIYKAALYTMIGQVLYEVLFKKEKDGILR